LGYLTSAMSSTAVLKTSFDILHYSGAAALARPFLAGQGVIFCLHHVTPGGGCQSGFSPNARLEITPEFLGEIITLVKSRGYECLSISAAVERLKSGVDAQPFVVFTLDDGYKDNMLHAYPVFQKFNCPFTIYVTPRIAEGICELWWRGLEGIIARHDHLDLTLANRTFKLATTTEAEKWRTWKILSPLVQNLPQHEQRRWIRSACETYGVDLDAMCGKAAMTWDEIRAINRDPLTTIGAHTVNHYNLSRLQAHEAEHEIVESGRRIGEELGEKMRHFAYPYGNVDAAGPREFAICLRAGYESSVTTRLGTIVAGHASHLQALPRVMVSGRFQNPRHIDTLISGLPPLLFNKGKRIHVM
jgi:peptidoglycan/xylan/chitin deacetylase (PgdA/CDA1 family)